MALEHKPDAVVMVSYPEQAAGIALEWSAVGGTLRWYLPPSLRHQVFADNLPPSLVEGMVGVAAAVRDEAAFAAAFSSRWYGEEPTNGAAYYYDALAVWALAAEATWHEQGELTPEVLRQQLRAVTRSPGEKVAWNDLGRALSLVREGKDVDYVGASGEVDLDAHGDAAATATRFWTIRNGRVQDE
jgi:ABC-type branched-subunit amino acid transport system substrate-binding protein